MSFFLESPPVPPSSPGLRFLTTSEAQRLKSHGPPFCSVNTGTLPSPRASAAAVPSAQNTALTFAWQAPPCLAALGPDVLFMASHDPPWPPCTVSTTLPPTPQCYHISTDYFCRTYCYLKSPCWFICLLVVCFLINSRNTMKARSLFVSFSLMFSVVRTVPFWGQFGVSLPALLLGTPSLFLAPLAAFM